MIDHNEKQKKHWDNYAKEFSLSRGLENNPIVAALGNLAKIRSSNSIIDVGCGPGYGVKYLSHLCKTGTIIYGVDFSSEMITICNEVFSQYIDFNSNTNNSFEVLQPITTSTTDKLSLTPSTQGVHVKFIEANCESLPFQNEQFDSYISSLCFQITNDYSKALNEMYRILKPGGHFAFAIWGKKEEMSCRMIEFTCERYGIDIDVFNYFKMGEHPEKIITLLKQIGFTNAHYEYFTQFRNEVETAEDFYNTFYSKSLKNKVNDIAKVNPQKATEIEQAIKDDLNTFFNKGKIPLMSVLIIYGCK